MMMRRLLLVLALLLLAAPAGATAPRVAVLYFDNVGNPDLDMLRLGLSEMMIVELSNRADLAVVERNRINQVLGELDLQRSDKVDPAQAVELGKLLGAERLVLGSYFELLGTLTVTASVVEVETGQNIGGFKTQGPVAQFTSLLEQVTRGVTPALVQGRAWLEATPTPTPGGAVRGAGEHRPSSKPGVRRRGRAASIEADGEASAPADPAEAGMVSSEGPDEGSPPEAIMATADPLGAAMAFSEGLDYLDRKDLKRARDALQRAVDLDPGLAVARDELSRIKI